MKKLRGVLVAGILAGMCGMMLAGCSQAGHEDPAAQEVISDADEELSGVTAGTGEESGQKDEQDHGASDSQNFGWQLEEDLKAGSNNANVNYIGEPEGVPGTIMISDGEYLFVAAMTGVEATGIWRYPLADVENLRTGGSLVYEIPIPEDQMDPTLSQPEYGGPVAMGMLDAENLCVVMPAVESVFDQKNGAYNEVVEFQKIPAFDVTYARGGEVYDTCEVSTFLTPATMAGSWFYFERDLGSNVRALMRKSVLDGTEETVFEYDAANGESGVPRLTFAVDETYLTVFYYRDGDDENGMVIRMDTASGAMEVTELAAEGNLQGVHEGYVYYTACADSQKVLYRMENGIWEPEVVCTDYRPADFTAEGCINFYGDTMYVRWYDRLDVVPLENLGLAMTDYESYRLYTAMSPNQAPAYPSGGIWIWDGKLWAYSCLQEPNSNLKVFMNCEDGHLFAGGETEIWPYSGATMDEAIANVGEAAVEVTGALEDDSEPPYELICNTIFYNDYLTILTGAEENADVFITSFLYLEAEGIYRVSATLAGGDDNRGMQADYEIDFQRAADGTWNVVNFRILEQTSYGV